MKMSKKLILITIVIIICIIILLIIIIFKLKKSKNIKRKIQNNWGNSYEKAQKFISKLNQSEKIELLYGIKSIMSARNGAPESELYKYCEGHIEPLKNDEIDFKGMCLQDGPSGVRYSNGTSISWQSNINLASTFNKKLMYDIGKAQGEECKEKGINVILSPCVNIMRTPQAGRVWEAYGEDPFYSGVCASQIIKGIQDAGVIATIKHFIGNEQETYRQASSSNIEMGPLMDIYAEPFYRAIHDAEVGAVMSSYNAVNNKYCSENKFLLTDILRGILDFKGFVISDWFGIYSNHSDTFNSGLDMNMPGGERPGPFHGRDKSFWSHLNEYVENGEIPEERITESATRIIATMYKMNQMEKFPEINIFKETKTEERKKLQRKAATESQILLKNEDNILPLKNIKRIAVIGNGAQKRDCEDDTDLLCQNDTNKVQNGFIPLGYGSGATTFNYLISPLEGIIELAKKKDIEIIYSCELIYEDIDGVHIRAQENYEKGVEVASRAEVAIVFVKADSGEEFGEVENTIGDRPDLDLWHGANTLIENIINVNENIIVVINAPAVVNLPWLDKVKAVIFLGFPGAESGYAIADILFGEINPSGHLPFVWAEMNDYCSKIEHLEDSSKREYRYNGIDSAGLIDDRPGYDKEQYNYTEGLYVGQRWFNKKNKQPIFPFGYGLTYTNFEYSNLKVSINKEGLIGEFSVKNIGPVSGSAVPMMFLTFPDNIGDYPKYIFKGFEKIEVEPGKSKNINIKVDDHALSYFNVEENKYIRVNEGKIKVYIGENGDPLQAKLSAEIDSKY